MAKKGAHKTVETLKHDEDKRKNIPTAEFQSSDQRGPQKRRFRSPTSAGTAISTRSSCGAARTSRTGAIWSSTPRRSTSRRRSTRRCSSTICCAPTREREHDAGQSTADLFSDFNGIPKGADKTEFYQHDQNWSNRMILGDSLQVMASLAEREGLRGKVQCIYIDPPYGIKFNSNFQWSTTSRDVKDGNVDHITREPEQVKAFRDTWRDGIHSYLTYLRDRLTVARDLLDGFGLHLRSDRRRECPSGPGADGRGVRRRELRRSDPPFQERNSLPGEGTPQEGLQGPPRVSPYHREVHVNLVPT